jgi:hypothetical protein
MDGEGDENSDSDTEYTVEKILENKVLKNGQEKYFVSIHFCR